MAAPKLISRRYEVLELLGQGGMGTVYKVRHTALGSISALKVLPPELMQDPEMVTRFYREARIMANLSHPSIVRVLDIDQDDALDFHYFVMEHVEGQTLKQYVEQKGSLTLEETLDVVGQVARALAYAHAHSPPIIHRDIKPSNIMIEGRSGRVVVMDFGIAKELDGKELTRPGVTIGTLKYCAPEQMRQEQLDGAVDVYALGMVMYEAYTGKHLFAGLSERELVKRVLVEQSENAPVFEKPTPQAFADLVARAIAKSREVRFPSMAAFIRELDACIAECATAPAHSGTTGRFRPRLVASRSDAKVTELKPEWRDVAATKPTPAGPTPQIEQQVQELRERARRLRDATSSLKGRHRDRAERGFKRAEKLLEEGRLDDAKTGFEEAATLFGALTTRVSDDTPGGAGSAAGQPATAVGPRREVEDAPQLAGAAALARSSSDDTVVTPPPSGGATRSVGQPASAPPAVGQPPSVGAPTVGSPTVGVPPIAASAAPGAAADPAAPTVLAPRAVAGVADPTVTGVADPTVAGAVEPTVVGQRPQGLAGLGTSSATPVPGRGPLLPVLIGAGVLLAAGVVLYLASGDDAPPAQTATDPAPVVAVAQQAPAPAAPVAVAVAPPQPATQPVVEPAPPVASTQPAAAPAAPGAQTAATTEAPSAPAPAAVADEAPPDDVVQQAGGGDDGTNQLAAATLPRPEPTRAAEPVAAAVQAVAPPPAAPAAAQSGTDSLGGTDEVASDVQPIIRFTRNPTVEITVEAPAGATVTLDDRPVKLDRTGKARGSLTGLPQGTTEHRLRVTAPDGTIEETPVFVTYYPAWEMRRFGDVKGETYAVAFSPDGAHVFAGTRSNVVKMYDAATGTLERTFSGHRDWVNDVAVSPDGQTIVSGSKDRTLRLWDVATGNELRVFEGHKGWVNGVAFSPDGKTIASVSDDQTVKLWDVASGEQRASLTGHKDWILAVAFSSDGRTVASGGRDKVVKLWDASSGELLQTLSGHGDWVNAVAFSPDGRLVASASDDRRIKLWDTSTGKAVKTLSGHGGWVVGLAFSPDGSKLISASKDQTVRLWDVATGQEVRTFSGHKGLVGDVAFGPDGKSAVSGGRDRTLRLWWTAHEPTERAGAVEKSRDSG